MTHDPRPTTPIAPGRYCRDVESYLCRQNDGHLVRIVGPAFELVCGWAERQIPLRIVCGAIDRTRARHDAKRRSSPSGQSRRPLRIEFCEADVLELFDEWRRAVGVGTAAAPSESQPTSTRRPSLVSHLDRIADRLTAWREASEASPAVAQVAAKWVDEIGALQERARTARGPARQEIVARLGEMEPELAAALHDVVDPTVYDTLRAEAARDLEPYRERMPPEALAQAKRAGTDRLLYDHFKLPRIAF